MTESSVVVREAMPEDAAECGRICYAAFSTINARHGFPCDFPGPEAAVGLMSMMFSAPGIYCVVAETDGKIVGSNCMDVRAAVHGVGPITVDPGLQNRGAGRALMCAVIEHSAQLGAAGVRLVQAAFHSRSLSLYASLGFEVREPLSCMQGRTRDRGGAGCEVRAAAAADLDACNALSHRVHGFDRGAELAGAIQLGTAVVVERGGRITGYSSHLGFFGHTTAETNADLQAMIAAADELAGSGILVPSRNSGLFHWCLQQGLRVVQPMTLMSTGLYSEPAGAWLPSVIY